MMRTSLVTGSSSGFGRGLVSALLARGWKVYATLRDADARAGDFAADREAHGDRLVLLALDVTDGAQRDAVARRVAADGSLDCLVNNAGYAQFGALEDLDEAQLRRQLEVNFFGAALLTRALLPALRAARGSVLNVSSVFGFSGFPLTGAYCASKYALEGLSESLYYELAPHGVRVGLVEPGGFRTRFGASVEWGHAENAVYGAQTRGYRKLHAKIGARPNGTPPDAVIATLVRLAEARRVPLRTVVGRDALATALLQRLVPEWLRAPATGALLGRLFQRAGAAE
ncbi:MAG: SDR-family protein [Myxococcales bacterium]|nr:SDR-family protein [Myxococcales bacterium]